MASNNLNEDLLLGKIPLESSGLFLCDLQEKFRPAMLHFKEVITNAKKLVETTKVVGIPLIVTEQYPKGLGSTVSEIDIQHAAGIIPKTKFSMYVPEVEEIIQKVWGGQLKCAILFGVEAHVCVEQTAMDLISRGIKVHIVADATTSRTQEDRMLAFDRLKQIGCFITTSENIIYKILGDKDHPKFNEIRPLIKEASLETGLVSKMNDGGVAKLSWRLKIELVHTVLTKLIAEGYVNYPLNDLMNELMTLKKDTMISAENKNHLIVKEGNDNKSLEKKCSVCGKEFKRPQELRRHLLTHENEPSFLCEECGKSYRSRDGLRYHKEMMHLSMMTISSSPTPSFACKDCEKSFPSQSQLKVHLKNSHLRRKGEYTCELCNPPTTFKR